MDFLINFPLNFKNGNGLTHVFSSNFPVTFRMGQDCPVSCGHGKPERVVKISIKKLKAPLKMPKLKFLKRLQHVCYLLETF